MGGRSSRQKADITTPPPKEKKLKRKKSKKEAAANGGIEEVSIQEKKDDAETVAQPQAADGVSKVPDPDSAKKAETDSNASGNAPTDIVEDSPDKEPEKVAQLSEVQSPSETNTSPVDANVIIANQEVPKADVLAPAEKLPKTKDDESKVKEATTEKAPEAKPELVAELKPDPVVEAKSEVVEPKEPVAEAKPVPAEEPKPAPVTESKSVEEQKAEPVVETKPEPAEEPKSQLVVEAKAEPVEEPKVEPVEVKPEPTETSQPEPAVETKLEPKSEPVVEVAKSEPVQEPATEVEPEPVELKPEPVVESKAEPVVESKPEIEPEPCIESKSEVVVELQSQLQAEPVVESQAEQSPQSVPVVESIPAAPAESVPEIVPESDKNELADNQLLVEPESTKPVSEPVAVESVSEPVAVESVSEPVAVESRPEPVVELQTEVTSPAEPIVEQVPSEPEPVATVQELSPIAPAVESIPEPELESPVASDQKEQERISDPQSAETGLDSSNISSPSKEPISDSVQAVANGEPESVQENESCVESTEQVPSSPNTNTFEQLNGIDPVQNGTVEVTTNGKDSEDSSDVPTLIAWKHGGKEVAICGDFLKWTDNCTLSDNDGVFSTKIKLPIGEHHIKFLVDGEWKVDESEPIVELEGHGQVNLLVVSAASE